MPDVASAAPQKRLFIELITKDITLEDAILDMIDNAINNVLVREKVNLVESFDEFIAASEPSPKFSHYRIAIRIDSTHFIIEDNCGGIPYDAAKNTVFQFGRSTSVDAPVDTLSVYGIGLKRALFKIGDSISLKSRHDRPFEVKFRASEWRDQRTGSMEADWKLPLVEIPPSALKEEGTVVEIGALTDETVERIRLPNFCPLYTSG
jgi:hypothetical protein